MRLTIFCLCLCLIFYSSGSASAENSVIFYRDGALFQLETTAAKGIIDIPIATAPLDHTFTVIPAPGTTILGVETRKSGHGSGVDKELDVLTEQRRRLEDRLQALETREAIFTSAAKTQSGKAPRKTKANPDPMQTIRQGTDFAIAQLEAVYTARRRTLQEMKKIDARLAVAGKNSRTAGSSVRISVTPPRGRATIRYATAERGWLPGYNLYLDGSGSAVLQLSGQLTMDGRGDRVRVSAGSLAESAAAETFPVREGSAVLARYRVPIKEEFSANGIFTRFSGTITNSTPHYLLPGESGLFRKGTYLGSFAFAGMSSGRSRVISLGN